MTPGSAYGDVVACVKAYWQLNNCQYDLVDGFDQYMTSRMTSPSRLNDALMLEAFAAFLDGFKQSAITDPLSDLASERFKVAGYFELVAYSNPVAADVHIVAMLNSGDTPDITNILLDTLQWTLPYDQLALNQADLKQALYNLAVGPGVDITVVQNAKDTSAQFFPVTPTTTTPPGPSSPKPPAPPKPSAPSGYSVGQIAALVGLGVGIAGILGFIAAHARAQRYRYEPA